VSDAYKTRLPMSPETSVDCSPFTFFPLNIPCLGNAHFQELENQLGTIFFQWER